MTSLRRIRTRRVIPLVLAVAWLPYMSVRCIGDPATHTGCGILPAPVHAQGAEAHVHAHEGDVPAQPAGHGQKHKPPLGCMCCNLMAKCATRATPAVPSLAPLQLATQLPATVQAVFPHLVRLHQGPATAVAHAPPTYLLNVTLLI